MFTCVVCGRDNDYIINSWNSVAEQPAAATLVNWNQRVEP